MKNRDFEKWAKALHEHGVSWANLRNPLVKNAFESGKKIQKTKDTKTIKAWKHAAFV